MPEDEWTISPDDVAVKDAVIHHTERGCVDLLLPEEETLISLQAEDLYITVYHPTEEILSLLRQAVSESGFYIWQTPQIERIKKYESYMDEATLLIRTDRNSDRLKYLISELEAYYESVKWRKDFENDEAGLLPKNLKRGVLSEDGINDLLDEYKEVIQRGIGMTLYINCCVREESRTDRLARAVLQKLGGDFTELKLYEENLKPLDRETLIKRTSLIEQGDYSDQMFDYAKQFASADEIVIAAPYWDLSFPATLKTYIENIYVTGIVSTYDESGMPVGLCKAKELYYITTAGGPYDPTYSYGYIESLAKNFFGIPETHLVKAEMLDIIGNDSEEILNQKIATWDKEGD